MRFTLAMLFSLFGCVHPAFADGNPIQTITNDNTSVTITAAAFVQLTASTGMCNSIRVFNSSSKPIFLALGAASTEIKIPVDIPPSNSMWDEVRVRIPSGVRLSAKAIGADATTGYLIFTCLQ